MITKMSLLINPRSKKSTKSQIFIVISLLLTCCLGFFVWNLLPYLPGIDRMYLPTWSADSQSIAVECFFDKPEYDTELSMDLDNYIGGPYYWTRGWRDICIVNKKLQLMRRLTDTGGVYAPAWSPNGQFLAWIHGNSNEISIWDAKNNRIKSYISSQYLSYSSFDSDQLVWLQDNASLYIQGSGIRLDLVSERFYYLPEQENGLYLCCSVWSPDGKLVARKQGHDPVDIQGDPDYTIMIYKDNDLIININMEATRYDPFIWSPDSTVLTWVSSSSSSSFSGDQLSFTDVSTGKIFTLNLKDSRLVRYPTWSPNGTQIAYMSYDDIHILTLQRQSSIFAYTVSDDLTHNIGDILRGSPLVWSPNGQQIAYGTSDGKIVILSQSDGQLILGDH